MQTTFSVSFHPETYTLSVCILRTTRITYLTLCLWTTEPYCLEHALVHLGACYSLQELRLFQLRVLGAPGRRLKDVRLGRVASARISESARKRCFMLASAASTSLSEMNPLSTPVRYPSTRPSRRNCTLQSRTLSPECPKVSQA